MITEHLSTLKIHRLTKQQYERELAAGRLDSNALYLTPDNKEGESTQIYSLSTNISLFADRWIGDTSPYRQVVTVNNVNNNSKVDLCPTIEQLVSMSEYGIALVAINEDSVVTVYAFNSKPINDLEIQATITDIAMNAEGVGF